MNEGHTFNTKRKTPLLKSLSYRHQQKQKNHTRCNASMYHISRKLNYSMPFTRPQQGEGPEWAHHSARTCDFVSKKQTRKTGVQNGHHFAWHNIRWLCKKKSSLGNRVQDGHPTPGDSMALWEQLCFRTAASAKGQLHSSDIYGLMNNQKLWEDASYPTTKGSW